MKTVYNYISLIICTFLVFQTVSGQENARFTNLGIEHGLSNGSVTAIEQDTIGFIWIGTKNGLNRYDGRTFRIYSEKNSNLSSNDISDILVDKKGRMWISTIGGGINRYDIKTDTFKVFQNEKNDSQLGSNVVNSLFEDNTGNLWATTNKGLSVFVEDSQTFKTFLPLQMDHNKNDPSAADMLCMHEESNGLFWIGTNGGGLYLFDSSQNSFIEFLPNTDNLIDLPDYILSIARLGSDKLLLGSRGKGVVGLDTKTGNTFEFLDWGNFPTPVVIWTIWRDSFSNIWVGTDGDGLFKFSQNGQLVSHYVRDNRLSSTIVNNTINDLFEDDQGNLWIGTAWRGISVNKKNDGQMHRFYSDGKGYDSQPVLSLFKKNDSLWMGLDGQGLNVLNIKSGGVNKFNKFSSIRLNENFIQCIEPHDDGRYWLGTFSNGLVLFDTEKGVLKKFVRKDSDKNSLPFNDVRDIVLAPSGSLWIGTWGGGLSHFNTETEDFTNYRHNEDDHTTIASDNVIALLEDGPYLWIATHGGGLSKYDIKNDSFTQYQKDENDNKSIGSNYIFSILRGKGNCLWLGTKNGLSKFDFKTQTFKNFNIGTSLTSNTVVSLLQDGLGRLLLGTKNGIYNFNPEKETVQVLPHTNFEFHINSAFIDDVGIAYFGGINGVVSIDTKLPIKEDLPKKIVFTDFKLFNESQKVNETDALNRNMVINDEIKLKHHQNVITFDFTSLQYPISHNRIFEVKMLGFEDYWRPVEGQASVTYTNLAPGFYEFHARLKDVDTNELSNSIKIEIQPPLYRTWWAYLIYSVLALSLLGLIRFYTLRWAEIKNNLETERLQREKEDEVHRLKQRFFTNISHEIRTPLTLILGALNSLTKENLKVSEIKQLNTVKNSTNRLMNLVNELLNIRKLETGNIKLQVSENDIVTFVHEIYLAFSQQAISKTIDYKFIPEIENLQVWFDKGQLEKTIYNLLTNAFKFTPGGGAIVVTVKSKKGYSVISVKDSGPGIPQDKIQHIFERFYQNENSFDKNIGFGIGLSITRDIVELHHGTIGASNRALGGSTFEIKLPLGRNHFTSDQIVKENIDVESRSNYLSNAVTTNKHELDFRDSIVLVVEDNDHLREFLTEMLSQEFEILQAANGKEGLKVAQEQVPDLVLTDIMMPIMDGVTLCYELKTNIATSHIPVILLTARDMVESIMEGYETGADDYLTKPFHEGLLKSRIKNLLRNRKKLQERYQQEFYLNPKEVVMTSPDQKFLSKLHDVLEKKLDQSEFHIDKLSAEMAMSHSGLYKKLKALTGMTLVAFIRDYRLKRAAQLFKQHKYSVFDVCFMVGYTDRKHFSKEFKKKFGLNPSEFAKNKNPN